MICPFCKEEIADGAIKCKHCSSLLYHADLNSVASGGALAQDRTKPIWTSITSMVLGILILLTCINDELTSEDEIAGGFIIAVFVIVLASVSLAGKHRGNGMAIAGLVMGILSVLTLA